jgi:transposase
MSKNTEELKKDLEASKETLLKMRDEIKLKIHLASMDAKDAWAKISTDIERVSSKVGHEITEQSKTTLHELVERAKKLRDSLKSSS